MPITQREIDKIVQSKKKIARLLTPIEQLDDLINQGKASPMQVKLLTDARTELSIMETELLTTMKNLYNTDGKNKAKLSSFELNFDPENIKATETRMKTQAELYQKIEALRTKQDDLNKKVGKKSEINAERIEVEKKLESEMAAYRHEQNMIYSNFSSFSDEIEKSTPKIEEPVKTITPSIEVPIESLSTLGEHEYLQGRLRSVNTAMRDQQEDVQSAPVPPIKGSSQKQSLLAKYQPASGKEDLKKQVRPDISNTTQSVQSTKSAPPIPQDQDSTFRP